MLRKSKKLSIEVYKNIEENSAKIEVLAKRIKYLEDWKVQSDRRSMRINWRTGQEEDK